MLLAFTLGALLPLQTAINGRLAAQLGSPYSAACVSFAVGAGSLFLVLLSTRQPLPWQHAGGPWWMWLLGGLIGACYVSLIIVLVPKLGMALSVALLIGGQMALALLIDHAGWLGSPQHALNGPRLLGAGLIVAGVALIRKF
jgi:transporter family-2 protein